MMLPSSSPQAGYNMGYVFFTHAHHVVADGINWFERWQRGDSLPVQHTGIVVGNDYVTEAHWRGGVRRVWLHSYLEDTETLVVFRKPRGWTSELGLQIAGAAMSREGLPYDKGLILSQLASNTVIGHLLNKWFKGRPEIWMSQWLDRRQAFICSELSAWALSQQPEFKGKGILSLPLNTITPQELYDDEVIWEP